jgi:hypothetical protein
MFKILTIDQLREMIPYLGNYPSIDLHALPKVLEVIVAHDPVPGYTMFGMTPAIGMAGLPMCFLFKKNES